MIKRLHAYFFLSLFLLSGLAATNLFGQTTTTISAVGGPGSYITGSVNAAGTKNDDTITTLTTNSNRGWAVFDLSTIPSNATINSVNVIFTTFNATGSGGTHNIGGYGWTPLTDPATVSGSSLYTLLNASATPYYSGSWTANASNTKAFNAAGVSMIAANLGGQVVISWQRANNSAHSIYGYSGTTAQKPKLEITYTVLTPCTGTPVPGNTVSTVDSICSGTSFSLSLQNSFASQSGITYQWQSSTNGSTWTAISNATNSTYSATQTVATYYQCLVTCSGSATGTSAPKLVTMKSFLGCYCTPTYSSGTSGGDYISLVQIGGTTLNNATAGASSPYFTVYPQAGNTTASLVTTFNYTITVSGGTYSTCYIRGWIDYNQNGVFSSSESIGISTNVGAQGTASFTFTVPAGALAGTTRLRLRSSDTGPGPGTGDVCNATNSGWGEAEDYYITIVASTACAGAPAPGNTLSTADSICSGSSFTLSLQTPPSNTGITYQWQSSPNGATWTSITNATNSYYTTSQTAATYYQCLVTCNGTSTTPSTPKYVSIKSWFNCYCTATSQYGASGGYYGMITNVHLDSLNNTTAAAPTPYYVNYPASTTTTSVGIGVAYTLSVTSGYENMTRAWIDWDHSGSFDASESYDLGANSGSSMWTGTANILVPTTALTGQTKMRIRTEDYYDNLGAGDACTYLYYGETEDYTISVVVPPTCTGTPAPGNTLATADSVCPGTPFNLSIANPPQTAGISYQWQSSPNGTTWTAIAGATNSFYTGATQTANTYYRNAVTCSGNTGYAATKLVTIKNWLNCYCTPVTDCSYPDVITSVQLLTLNNITNTNCNSTNGFTLYSTPVTTVPMNATDTLTVKTGGDTEGAAAWIDYNHNGSFETGEMLFSDYQGTNPATYTNTFVIPANAMTGLTRMRVRAVFNTAPTNPCSDESFGETEDYLVNITTGPLEIKLGDITATNNGPQNTLKWNSYSEQEGDYYLLERSTDGTRFYTIADVPGNAKAYDYTYIDRNPVKGINYYRLKLMDASGTYSYSKTVAATVKGGGSFSVAAFPNPATHSVTVSLNGDIATGAQITIEDLTGKAVRSIMVTSAEMTVPIAELASGMYLIKYTDAVHTQTIKLSKQ